ncbi:MAG: UvrD-helicase domain-containing protein [Myxococcaceae bacterium]|nr:UvrD-helicase domain-containing protein [Myxococcaceae bacterium]
MSDALLEDLNAPQKEAVLHDQGPLLVLSGAGSGKTRVITRRVAFLVQERGVQPWRILAVTFTNKAAREMRDRLFKLLGGQAADLVVATFHSASAMILRREAEAVGLSSSFVIYDDADQLALVKRAAREANVDITQISPRELLSRIDRWKNAALTPERVHLGEEDYRNQIALRVYRAYQRQLRAANAVDFGDLLLLLVELLRTRPDIRRKYQSRFEYVLVDEFQDTNPVQYELLQLIAPPPSSNLCVVGDDDQSIYRWRGADVGNILGFPETYSGAKVVKLEQNYRSDQNILDAAYSVISRNRRRMDKRLWSDRPRGAPLSLLISRDERGEAQAIARGILELRREGLTDPGQIAVFYRTHAQSRVLEEALRLERIPYTLVNGRSFYERAEVKDAASYLRLMVNPRSDADLLRVINTPGRGIGDTTVERLTDFATQSGMSLYEALGLAAEISTLNAGAQRKLSTFRALLDRLQEFGRTAPDAASAVEFMLKETNLVVALEAEGTDEALGRAENLRELFGAAQQFDLDRAAAPPPGPEQLAADVPPLQAFLEQISLLGDADQPVGEGRVALMTLHAAKGLEFDAVFMAGMEEEVFPHARALDPDADEEEMDEERRLCYVGFTRARKRLFLSLAQSRALFGELKFNAPSRFIREVPQELFDFSREEELSRSPPPTAIRPTVRRRSYDDDTGPQIDRSYDQSVHYEDVDRPLIGLRVRHNQFGEGRIVACDGQGPNAKLTVDFPSVGLKRVIARFLTPLG